MKRIYKLTALTVAVFTLALAVLTSCGGGRISKLGITFDPFEGMEERKVSYADICYVNDDVEIFINVFSREALEDPEVLDLDDDITVRSYAEFFIGNNSIKVRTYDFDEARNAAYITSVEGEGEDAELYGYLIMRSYDFLYIAGIECEASLIDIYEPQFKAWADAVVIDSPQKYVPTEN